MAISKVEYNGNVLMDLTNDTVSEENLLAGYIAHKSNGEQITGSVVVQTCYTDSAEPDNSLGVDGDVYLMY